MVAMIEKSDLDIDNGFHGSTPSNVSAFIKRLPYEAFDHRVFRRRYDMGITALELGRLTKLYARFSNLERGLLNTEALCPEHYSARDQLLWTHAVTGATRPKWLTEEIQTTWEDALQVPRGWLLNRSIPTPTSPLEEGNREHPGPKIKITGRTVAEELYVVCALISQNRSGPKKTLNIDELDANELRNTNVLALRYGLDLKRAHQDLIRPDRKTPYHVIGAEFGFGQERARQILAKHLRRGRAYQGRFELPLTDSIFTDSNPKKSESNVELGQITHFGLTSFCKEVLNYEG